MSTTTAQKTIIWNQINQPGTYICHWSGHLVRFPQNSFNAGRPIVNFESNEPLTVTFLSDDPQLPIDQARKLASNCGVTLTF